MSTEGGSINVGGVNFTIGIDLATFEANLAKAEEIAKVRAKRIQEALNKKTTDGGTTGASGPGSAEQIQQIVVQQKRSTKPPTESIQLPPTPPTIYLTQEVVVTRHLRVVDKTGLNDEIKDIPVAGKGPAFESGATGGVRTRGRSGPEGEESGQSLAEQIAANEAEDAAKLTTLRSARIARQSNGQGPVRAAPTSPASSTVPKAPLTDAQNRLLDAGEQELARRRALRGTSTPNSGTFWPTDTQNALYDRILSRERTTRSTTSQEPSTPIAPIQRQYAQTNIPTRDNTSNTLSPEALLRRVGPAGQQSREATYRGYGFSPNLARAVASGQVSPNDAVRAHGQGADAVAALLGNIPGAAASTSGRGGASANGAATGSGGGGRSGGSGGGGSSRSPSGSSSRGGINPFEREFNPAGLVRIAAGFTGIGLGINIAAGAARDLHQAMVAVVESAVQLEQSGRNIGTAFGASGSSLTGATTAFTNNPTTKGTTAEFQSAAASAAPLAAQFGLSKAQILELTTAEGQLARLHGIELPAASQVLQSVLRGNVEAGQQLDLELTDQYGVLKNVGLTWQQLVAAQGPAAATATLLAQVQGDVNRQMQNSAATITPGVQALDNLSSAWDRYRSTLAKNAQPIVQAGANAGAAVLNAATGPPTQPEGPSDDEIRSAASFAPAEERAAIEARMRGQRQAQIDAKRAADSATKDAQDPNSSFFKVANPPGFDPENPSKEFLDYTQNPGLLAYQRAKANQAAGKVPGSEMKPPTPEQLRANSTGQAIQQQTDAGVQAALAQSKIDIISATADQRRLTVQGDINNLLSQRINLQDQLAPMLISEQAIQNNIAQITRENLDLTRNKLIAQQAALGPQEQVAGFDFARNQANARIGLSISQSVAGQKPTFDIGQQVNTILQNSAILNPNVAQANVNNVEGQRGVQVAGFAQQEDVLQKQINAIPDMQQLQDLQLDNINNIKLQIAAVDSQSAAIDRYLQAQTLEGSIQEALIGAELALIDARTKGAQATGQIAQNTIDESAGRIPPVSVIVNLGGLTVGSDEQDLLNKIQNATSAGVIDGLARGASLNPPRVDPNTAGGR